MKNKNRLVVAAMLLCSLTTMATVVNVPTDKGSFINWNNATTTGCKIENDGANVGSTGSTTVVTFALSNDTKQPYYLTFKTGSKNEATMKVTVKNGETELFSGNCTVVNTGAWALSTVHMFALDTLPVSTDLTLELRVTEATSYAGNWGDLAIHSAAQSNRIPGTTAIDLSEGVYGGNGNPRYESTGDNVGYVANGGYASYITYCEENAYLNMQMYIPWQQNDGQFRVTVYDGLGVSAIQEAQNTFDITSADLNTTKECIITAPVTVGFKTIRLDFIRDGEGYIANYKDLKFTKRADYDPQAILMLNQVTINGVALSAEGLAALKGNGGAYKVSGNIYTAQPVVTAAFNNGSDAEVNCQMEGNSAVYTLSDGADFASALTIEGIHVYTPMGEEESVNIKNNEGERADGVWTNGVYTLATNSLDGYNQYFKMNGNDYTLSLPADVQVKQLIFKECSNNYAGNNARLQSVTSTGATAYIPTENKFYHSSEGSKYDLIVNIDNHTAGNDISFNLPKSGQPMCWIQLTTVKVATTTAPQKTNESVAIDDNDAVVAVSFDREIVNEVSATIAGKTVKAKGGSTTLYFPAWDLEYAHNYTLTIAAGAAKDAYDNVTDAAIEVAVNIPAKSAVVATEYDYVVSNATELLDALAEVRTTNENNVNAARKTIFLKNGDYDLGESNETVCWVRAHNLSLIGESRDGVIIHGTSTGISNPVLNLRYWQGYYLQDLTVRNDFDYGTGEFKGVSVAVYGGDKTIMKNVRMLSNQDTQVTGHRVYYEDCAIHGTVDFICGGGDNYYYHTDLVLENRGGNIIVAPSTNASHQWGYVFDHCTIKAVDETAAATNAGSYYLGRPWQNEPRAYYLYTTMEVQGAAAGWTNMSNLPTHFLEYDSRDAQDNVIDLSGRTNSPSSTNHYSPILTTDSAAMFTSRNVLGGADAWDAAAKAAQMGAPVLGLEGAVLSWDAVDDAMLYVVLKDGAYLAQTTGTSFTLTASGTYTVKAANRFGGLGAASAAKYYNATPTAIDLITNHQSSITNKLLRNGMLLIEHNGRVYTVTGVEVHLFDE